MSCGGDWRSLLLITRRSRPGEGDLTAAAELLRASVERATQHAQSFTLVVTLCYWAMPCWSGLTSLTSPQWWRRSRLPVVSTPASLAPRWYQRAGAYASLAAGAPPRSPTCAGGRPRPGAGNQQCHGSSMPGQDAAGREWRSLTDPPRSFVLTSLCRLRAACGLGDRQHDRLTSRRSW